MKKLYSISIGVDYKAEESKIEETDELDGIVELLEKLGDHENIEVVYKSFSMTEGQIKDE